MFETTQRPLDSGFQKNGETIFFEHYRHPLDEQLSLF
jgi:hypothetical protein